MHFVPTSPNAPLRYPERGPFRQPKSPQTFGEVVRRIRLFSQESLVTIGTRILWSVYREPELLDKRHPDWMGRTIAALFADRIVALACIHANNYRRPATEREFDLLCWELHNCPDKEFSDSDIDTQISGRVAGIENATLKAALAAVPPRALLADAFRARVAAFQLSRRWSGLPDFIRPLLIAEKFSDALERRCGRDMRRRLERFLQGSIMEFFRNGLVLNGLLLEGILLPPIGGGEPVRERGLVHLVDGPIGDAEVRELGVTGEGLRAFALRLSRTLESVTELRDELERIPEAERKYSQHINWLGRWPLIDLGVQGSSRRLVAPSPRAFAVSMERFLLYEMPRALVADGLQDVTGRNLNANDITSLRGEAYASYQRQVAGRHGVIDADTLQGVKGKRPDLIWVGEKYGILVEAKFTLLPNDDRALTNVSAAVATWERAFDALEQVTEFVEKNGALLRARWPAVTNWMPILVVHDPFPDETTRFKVVAKRAGLKSELFGGLAVLSTSEFERWIAHARAEDLGAEVKKTWDAIDPNAVSDQLLLEPPAAKGDTVGEHIRAAFARVLPGARFERVFESRER